MNFEKNQYVKVIEISDKESLLYVDMMDDTVGAIYKVNDVDEDDSTCLLSNGLWYADEWLAPVDVVGKNTITIKRGDLARVVGELVSGDGLVGKMCEEVPPMMLAIAAVTAEIEKKLFRLETKEFDA